MSRLPGRPVYLLFYGANAALLPILTLYYESAGVGGAQLGLLAALLPAGSMIGGSLWGAIADGSGRHRLVLSLTIGGAALAAQLLFVASSFLTLLPIVALFAFLASPIAPMLDHGVLTALGSNHDRFGRARLWGAVGWGVSAPLAGIVMDRLGLASAFPVYGVLMLGLLVASVRLPVTSAGRSADITEGMREIVRSRAWRRFLLLVLVTASGGAVLNHFLFIYLNEIGASGTLRGLALTVATASELVVFGLADRILRRVRARTLVLVSMAAVALRLLMLAIIRDPVLALIPQMLHGITFSLRLVAGVAIARSLAPHGMGATAQALFNSTNMGAAGIAGALLGGLVYRFVPVTGVFLLAGITEAVLLGAVLAAGLITRATQRG